MAVERSLQRLFEQHLEALLGVRFLASEYSTGPNHGGRIDTLGLDEDGCPVIIEYKRALNEAVINQGLFYLDWLADHQGDFLWLVTHRLDRQAAESVQFENARLICIAGDFTRYDEHAIRQINRNIELIRYKRFDDDLLLLELVSRAATDTAKPPKAQKSPKTQYATVTELLERSSPQLQDFYQAVDDFLRGLGDDVQMVITKFYLAYRRLRNFCCVEVHPTVPKITLYVRVNPDTVTLQEGFTRDVRNVGHFGTGDLEITLQGMADLDRAKDLIVRAYDES